MDFYGDKKEELQQVPMPRQNAIKIFPVSSQKELNRRLTKENLTFLNHVMARHLFYSDTIIILKKALEVIRDLELKNNLLL